MNTFENEDDFIVCKHNTRARVDLASIWVSSFVYECMSAKQFIGRFKFKNYRSGGDRSVKTMLASKCHAFPCNIVINLNRGEKGCKTYKTVKLLNWGMFKDGDIGISIDGVAAD